MSSDDEVGEAGSHCSRGAIRTPWVGEPVPHGAYWAYNWAGPTPAANMATALAVRGSLVTVVGSGRAAGTGWNQVVLEWRY